MEMSWGRLCVREDRAVESHDTTVGLALRSTQQCRETVKRRILPFFAQLLHYTFLAVHVRHAMGSSTTTFPESVTLSVDLTG